MVFFSAVMIVFLFVLMFAWHLWTNSHLQDSESSSSEDSSSEEESEDESADDVVEKMFNLTNASKNILIGVLFSIKTGALINYFLIIF